MIVDIDGVLVLAHSEKQDVTATWKKTFGHHPFVAFVDHGPAGSGEPVAALLRPGQAGSNTAADHIETAQLALAQLPAHLRRGHQTLIRTDSAGGTHAFLDWLSRPGRWLSYSVGMTITDAIHQAVLKIPKKAWTQVSRSLSRSVKRNWAPGCGRSLRTISRIPLGQVLACGCSPPPPSS